MSETKRLPMSLAVTAAVASLCTVMGEAAKIVGARLPLPGSRRGTLQPPTAQCRPSRQVSAQRRWASLFQVVLERVRPERAHNPRKAYREKWWLFAETRPAMREALRGLARFIVTPYTAVHRPFVFVSGDTIPDAMAYAIADDDAYTLGVLSSRVHRCFSLDAGSALEDRPRYNSKSTFLPFPFPVCPESTRRKIRDLGQQIDDHRKARMSAHSDITITGLYNLLEKLESGASLSGAEVGLNQRGLVSLLRKLHDDLDSAVFEAYGWPPDLTDDEILDKLVALNAERAEEERRGLVRWLRPEFQNPTAEGAENSSTANLAVDDEASPSSRPSAPPPSVRPWPRKMAEQLVVVRDVLARRKGLVSTSRAASFFTGVRLSDLENVLESLVSLGLVVNFPAEDEPRWKAVPTARASLGIA